MLAVAEGVMANDLQLGWEDYGMHCRTSIEAAIGGESWAEAARNSLCYRILIRHTFAETTHTDVCESCRVATGVYHGGKDCQIDIQRSC